MSGDPVLDSLRLADGGRLRIIAAEKPTPGGEGIIYPLAIPPGQMLKHYKPAVLASRGQLLADKIRAMVRNPPEDPTASQGHCSLAWPRSLVVDGNGAFAGFVMPAIDRTSSVELHMVANPSDRNRSQHAPDWLRGFTWQYLLRVTMNLASAAQALHDTGYVIGDFNERNVLVRKNTLVSLVDCDSMQVPNAAGPPFLCSVYRPEFTAPEFVGVNLSKQARTIESDRFPLAVHIYQLLMEGRHPYAGIWRGKGEKPKQHELAAQGLFVQKGDRRLSPQAGTPPFGIFTKDIRELFIRAFVDGATDPSARPDGLEWHEHLDRLARALVTCKQDKSHRYPGHLSACPWCALGQGPQVATVSRPQQAALPPAVAPAWPRQSPGQAAQPSPAALVPGWSPASGTQSWQPQWQPPGAVRTGYGPPAGTRATAGRGTARALPREYRFGWLSLPIMLVLAAAAFVAPLETLYGQAIVFVAVVGVSRMIGAGSWIRENGSRGFIGAAVYTLIRDSLGAAGLLVVAFIGLALAVDVLIPAVGPGNPNAYRQALAANGTNNPFSSAQQLGFFLHLFWILPAVATVAVVLLRTRADLGRPLALPRIARALNSGGLKVRGGVAGVLVAVTVSLIELNGGLSVTRPPSGAVCAIAPLTCHSVTSTLKLAKHHPVARPSHRPGHRPRHRVRHSSTPTA